MNSQTLGALASDQKIENVFHAFGFSVPVGKDGRRMWPTKFKREMARQMNSGKLSIGDVGKGCRVSSTTAYKWRQDFGGRSQRKTPKKQLSEKAFSEIKVADEKPKDVKPSEKITLKRYEIELTLPASYPIHQLVQLIRAMDDTP